jgi:hypothetical protein
MPSFQCDYFSFAFASDAEKAVSGTIGSADICKGDSFAASLFLSPPTAERFALARSPKTCSS